VDPPIAAATSGTNAVPDMLLRVPSPPSRQRHLQLRRVNSDDAEAWSQMHALSHNLCLQFYIMTVNKVLGDTFE